MKNHVNKHIRYYKDEVKEATQLFKKDRALEASTLQLNATKRLLSVLEKDRTSLEFNVKAFSL